MNKEIKPCMNDKCRYRERFQEDMEGIQTNCQQFDAYIMQEFCKHYQPEQQTEQEEKSCETCGTGYSYNCMRCGNGIEKYKYWQPKPQPEEPICKICEKPLTQEEIKVYQCSCGAMEVKKQDSFIDNNIKWRVESEKPRQEWKPSETIKSGVNLNLHTTNAAVKNAEAGIQIAFDQIKELIEAIADNAIYIARANDRIEKLEGGK